MSISFKKNSTTFSKVLLRIVLFLLVITTAFTGPWWFSFGFAAVLIILADQYEVILGGIILDIIFADEGFSLPVGDFIFTSILLVLVSVSWALSHQIRGIGKM